MKKGDSDGSRKPRSKDPKERPAKDVSITQDMLTACEILSGERYEAFVDNIEEGVYELDANGNFLYFNNSLSKILGYPREEIQLQNFTKFMDEQQAEKAFDTFGRIYQTGQGVSDLVWETSGKNGEIRVMELSANLITNDKGEKLGFRGIARDITDKSRAQKALRKSEQRYKTLLNFVPYPIVVFTPDGLVSYLNPAFTEVFGWSLEELEGKGIPYVPPGLERETSENITRLIKEKIVPRYETQRLTRSGQILDVVLKGAVYSESKGEPTWQLVILQDVTQEKRVERSNELLLKISKALPEYPELEGLLDYISNEIKRALNAEGALVILLDEEKNELFFKSAAHDDSATEKRIKEIRFPADKGIASKAIRTGESIVVQDTSKEPDYYSVVDMQAGFKTRNMLDVPLRSEDRTIGVLCAMNKKTGNFDKKDIELLGMIAGTVGLSIENARVSEKLKEAYKEVSSLNRAKDKVISHLSHELKTPLAVLSASVNILAERLSSVPQETWKATIERAQRNLDRILEMQYEVEDIMRDRFYATDNVIPRLLYKYAEQLVALVAEEVGEGPVVEEIRRRMYEIFGPKESPSQDIFLDQFVPKVLNEIRPLFSHRQVNIVTHFETTPVIRMPVDPLRKVVVGLIKNAIENTPDEGKIEVFVRMRGKGANLMVHDYGVGITEDNQKRIFEGFFTTQETMDYSSKRPYDFNAGGKGADLLRMRIFSERYRFRIDMTSSRCRYIPLDKDICPGKISSCSFCTKKEDCYQSGGTTFTIFFPVPSTRSSSAVGKP
jgi:PAS domain S-box-containing protein